MILIFNKAIYLFYFVILLPDGNYKVYKNVGTIFLIYWNWFNFEFVIVLQLYKNSLIVILTISIPI